ncbi:MAG TPA: cytidine deaminase [Cyclobacteriaceae bacterium]|jgi:cytidine deaminase|nr:cytidine deaminase [Cyclobacteriaceae bacterium]HNP06550.1 cytidine deaminase [Cyclobacteriaceae bacterium]HRK53530.1 cytidine deaminase [Cyclobacteriaceae bacterium]
MSNFFLGRRGFINLEEYLPSLPMKGLLTFEQIEDLDSESKYLVHKAKDAAQYAYAPYSKFHVGAALILENDILVIGNNQENVAYPMCMCAERVALYTAASSHQGKKIKKMAVVAHKKNQKELTAATPCGGCRQVMLEYETLQNTPIQIVLLTKESKWTIFPSASFLLPFSFNKENLI